MPPMEARLVNLEEKIAHLERYLGDLDEVVRDLHDRMDAYQREIAKMQATLEQQLGGDDKSGGSLEDERPPHW